MTGQNGVGGVVLGASTAGIALLPATGTNPIFKILPYATFFLGMLVIMNFIFTRIAKKFLSRA
jgi:hypothetical protein